MIKRDVKTVVMCNPCGKLVWSGNNFYLDNGTIYCDTCKDESGKEVDNIVIPTKVEEFSTDGMLGHNPYCDARGT